MNIIDTKISRHEHPHLVKVEFVGGEDAIMVSMRGDGVNDLSDDQAISRAQSVMSSCLSHNYDGAASDNQAAGVDQTLSQP